MFPGGMEVGDEELAALERVIRGKNLFRYYGVGEGPQEVAAFEREFAAHMGARRALCVNAGSSALICGLIGAGVGPDPTTRNLPRRPAGTGVPLRSRIAPSRRATS